jgi:hypothetical protein
MNVDVSHVDTIFFVDDMNGFILKAGLNVLIQFFYDGHKLGNHLLKIGKGPGFKGLRKNGVVGVGTGL